MNEVLYILVNNAGVAAKTTRIYLDRAIQGAARPFIIILQDSALPSNIMGGVSKLDTLQVRVLSYGDSYNGTTGAKTLAELVRTALENYSGSAGSANVTVKFENESTDSLQDANRIAWQVEQTYNVWLDR